LFLILYSIFHVGCIGLWIWIILTGWEASETAKLRLARRILADSFRNRLGRWADSVATVLVILILVASVLGGPITMGFLAAQALYAAILKDE